MLLAIAILAAIGAAVLLTIIGAATLYDYMQHRRLRAAWDADKETAPRGWQPPPAASHARTPAQAARVARMHGGAHA
jgi:hypothetical protein